MSDAMIAFTDKLGVASALGGICAAGAVFACLALAASALVAFSRAEPISAERLFFDDDLEAFGDEPLALGPPVRATARSR
ncbi:hypothetical protein [Methylocapsa palsarum]|uniref:Uncharacterized protein n=1 Tax=Methylocapsa palsarum TaxID=1612308 RepID=A0A1I3XDA1_9HYPH|nr:hypothetical protein [Methylocapsa palsarum]SFK17329.1 hypothetical protein SAMN05444581_10338 [Methylocapsa palsarum]